MCTYHCIFHWNWVFFTIVISPLIRTDELNFILLWRQYEHVTFMFYLCDACDAYVLFMWRLWRLCFIYVTLVTLMFYLCDACEAYVLFMGRLWRLCFIYGTLVTLMFYLSLKFVKWYAKYEILTRTISYFCTRKESV